MWLANSARGMRKPAGEVVTRIEDFTQEDYTVMGVIGVDDSPSCGVTKTLDIMGIARNQKALGISLDDVENPQLDKMKTILESGLVDGPGYFLGPIMEQLQKRSIDIPVIGFDPWAEPDQEVERIANTLGLEYPNQT